MQISKPRKVRISFAALIYQFMWRSSYVSVACTTIASQSKVKWIWKKKDGSAEVVERYEQTSIAKWTVLDEPVS